ncbi:MAG: LysM peptidoglycan-binding domain-containing protein, partial [Acidimicrobiales bacterium]
TWTVAPGDSFWSIAEEHLTDTRARPDADDAEIASYWRVLIAANRSLLADPTNPDLIYPGQVLSLPPVPPIA